MYCLKNTEAVKLHDTDLPSRHIFRRCPNGPSIRTKLTSGIIPRLSRSCSSPALMGAGTAMCELELVLQVPCGIDHGAGLERGCLCADGQERKYPKEIWGDAIHCIGNPMELHTNPNRKA